MSREGQMMTMTNQGSALMLCMLAEMTDSTDLVRVWDRGTVALS